MKNLCFVISLIVSVNVFADPVLENYCETHHGTLLSTWTCPSSGHVRTNESCLLHNSKGQPLVTDGCTGVQGTTYGDTFFKACVIHDFCYHNEPGLSGKQKADCDDELLMNIQKICGGVTLFGCQTAAEAFYLAVTAGGDFGPWECEKDNFAYPWSMDQL